MFFTSSFNKLYKTINVFSKGYNSRSFLLCSCQAQKKLEFNNGKTSQEINESTLQPDSKDDFIKIYRNHAIVMGAVINRLKLYQTLLTVCSVPTSIVLFLSGTVPEDDAVGIVLISTWLAVFLYLNGFLFHRAIGLIYLSKDNKTVKIGYLDFWGNKVEEEYQIEHVSHFSDLPETFTSRIFKTVDFDTEKYKLYLHYFGQVLDEDRFSTVFGAIK